MEVGDSGKLWIDLGWDLGESGGWSGGLGYIHRTYCIIEPHYSTIYQLVLLQRQRVASISYWG